MAVYPNCIDSSGYKNTGNAGKLKKYTDAHRENMNLDYDMEAGGPQMMVLPDKDAVRWKPWKRR